MRASTTATTALAAVVAVAGLNPGLLTAPASKRGLTPFGKPGRGLRLDATVERAVERAADTAKALDALRLADSCCAAYEGPLPWTEVVEWTLDHLAAQPGLRALPLRSDFADVHGSAGGKPAQLRSAHFESDVYERVRLTVFDAGRGAQVFNTQWTPRVGVDAGVLGADLLCFGGKRTLAVVDAQPMRRDPDYLARGAAPFVPIREKYKEHLGGTVSTRYYDSLEYFSDAMLMGRFSEPPADVLPRVAPGFKEYVAAHTAHCAALARGAPGGPAPDARESELRRFQQYSADNDPAHGLFSTYFSEAWAHDFVYGFLFPRATASEGAGKAWKAAPKAHQA